ncbi:hypothetical protein ABZ697_30055 [Streptomyces albidoflavus]|uniref:hypothetical protein n=1 Tax=Streptomyces albidoflavus TaxID=1886 RepID=UPI0033D3A1AB
MPRGKPYGFTDGLPVYRWGQAPAYLQTQTQLGQARLTVQGGTLRYGRYDQTRALQTVVWEAEQAARALGVPVRPVVAVHGAKVPAPRGRLELGGVTVVEAKRLRGLLRSLPPQPGWDSARRAAVGQLAERTLPPAS